MISRRSRCVTLVTTPGISQEIRVLKSAIEFANCRSLVTVLGARSLVHPPSPATGRFHARPTSPAARGNHVPGPFIPPRAPPSCRAEGPAPRRPSARTARSATRRTAPFAHRAPRPLPGPVSGSVSAAPPTRATAWPGPRAGSRPARSQLGAVRAAQRLSPARPRPRPAHRAATARTAARRRLGPRGRGGSARRVRTAGRRQHPDGPSPRRPRGTRWAGRSPPRPRHRRVHATPAPRVASHTGSPLPPRAYHTTSDAPSDTGPAGPAGRPARAALQGRPTRSPPVRWPTATGCRVGRAPPHPAPPQPSSAAPPRPSSPRSPARAPRRALARRRPGPGPRAPGRRPCGAAQERVAGVGRTGARRGGTRRVTRLGATETRHHFCHIGHWSHI